jgi:hypothetical protein
MTSSSDVTRCSVQDGAVWMHLDNVPVHLPSHLLNKSQILTDALSSVDDSSVTKNFTLAAPKAWLKAWMAYNSSEEERLTLLRRADIQELVSCLLVSFRVCNAAFVVLKPACICTCSCYVYRLSSAWLFPYKQFDSLLDHITCS